MRNKPTKSEMEFDLTTPSVKNAIFLGFWILQSVLVTKALRNTLPADFLFGHINIESAAIAMLLTTLGNAILYMETEWNRTWGKGAITLYLEGALLIAHFFRMDVVVLIIIFAQVWLGKLAIILMLQARK